MKKLLVLVMVLGIALPSFAGVKIKDVIGTWKYEVKSEGQILTGKIVFEKGKPGVVGKVFTNNGEVYVLEDIQIKEDNVLSFSLKINDQGHKVSVTLQKDKFEGTVSNEERGFPISGEKIK
jgi:ribosomal protein L35AE/L33A